MNLELGFSIFILCVFLIVMAAIYRLVRKLND